MKNRLILMIVDYIDLNAIYELVYETPRLSST